MEFVVKILKWFLWTVTTFTIMYGIASARMKSDASVPPGTLRHSKILLVGGILCFTLFAGVLAITHVYPNETVGLISDLVFGGLALLSLPLILEYVRVRHEYSDMGLTYKRLIGSGGFMFWSNIRAVTYKPTARWFRIENMDGDVARISAYLAGLPAFAQTLLRFTPAYVIDAATTEILQETARGNPPPLW